MKAIVFDIGNVLVRWDPHLAFLPDLGTREAVEAFLIRTDFSARNLRADGGEHFADLAREIADPADAVLFAGYVERYRLAVAEAIEGTWALMDALRARGHAIHAITNASVETMPAAYAAHPRLATSFGVTVVSGAERVLKPEARIFQVLCERAGVKAADCVFIDDSEKNVAGARAAGMDAIHFTGPAALAEALAGRGLL